MTDMTERQRLLAVQRLAEAIPYALQGNTRMVISHLQAVMTTLGLDELDAYENAYAAMRRGEANLNTNG